MTIPEYISHINKEYQSGRATEHSYRGYLQTLIKSLVSDVMITNEPSRVSCGAPDYIITRKDIPIGYIEAKDIGANLGNKIYKEQFERYRRSLSNLIITDYIDFWLYIDGEFIKKIKIGEMQPGKIISIPENHIEFRNLIKDFCVHISQTITSPKKLAAMMAGKARMLSDVIERVLNTKYDSSEADSSLKEQMEAFKEILIHDITPKAFSDVYAQTIAYGMFAARFHDSTLKTFSRQEAAELIPKSNPFLRKLFGYIAGPDIDDRIKWIVDSLAEIFLAANVKNILKDYGKLTKTEDPIIHFYETFLSEYDPQLRKSRGVWYTPAPIVKFIVRAIDDVLKNEFNLSQGLADYSKTKIKVKLQKTDKRYSQNIKTVEEEVHKLQILDPATGTGTFLAEVIKIIYKKFEGQQGIWSKYVENNLLPRLNGFELLMASYAMAHLQLDSLLSTTGFKPSKEQRFRVYLTNSLEESNPDTGTLFANWLSTEANEANQIKRDKPVMCVIGNPPYSGISSNDGEWIKTLIEDYKYVDDEYFNERKHWLNDDYVKFIRYGQHFIEKNGSGVLAFINPHGFLDNPTFRGMRWNLLKTYDKIYTIDLHGNAKKKEVSKDGSPDENVFDIQQGVSINIFIKTGVKRSNQLGKVYHHELFGAREFKYDFLNKTSLKEIEFTELSPQKPFMLFVDRSNKGSKKYESGFSVGELFSLSSVGMVSARDKFCIDDNLDLLKERITEFSDLSNMDNDVISKFGLKNTSTFNLSKARINVSKIKDLSPYYQRLAYRPFDEKWVFYNNDVVERPIMKVMQHFIGKNNIGLVIGRQGQVVGTMPWNLCFVTNSITDFNFYYRGGGMLYPLYIYPTEGSQTSIHNVGRVPNLNTDVILQFSEKLNLKFSPEKDDNNKFAPIDLLDYIYAVLHSSLYRDKYKEFLKIDFPRVPYPSNADTFWQLVERGSKLRQLHLFQYPSTRTLITKYPVTGDNFVGKIRFGISETQSSKLSESHMGNVFINTEQYFGDVPQSVWNFYIGGYQPAQKWLKDRKGKELSFDDIQHYQKIILTLSITIEIINEIDSIGFL